MAATRGDLQRWLQIAYDTHMTHMIVVCDDFDYEDYPVYVSRSEDVHVIVAEYVAKSMQRVMEVYSMELDMQSQLDEYRAFHY